MATLSAPGIGSGLDINGIIDSLMAVEQIPLQRLQVKAGDYLAQISAYGQLRSDMASFQDATAALASFDDFDAFSAQSFSLPRPIMTSPLAVMTFRSRVWRRPKSRGLVRWVKPILSVLLAIR